jgi:hypothetical protein
MSMQFLARRRRHTAMFAAAAALLGGSALADDSLPPAKFYYDVSQGHSPLEGCSQHHSTIGGSCGSESSGPGYAITSGGIGSPSYVPVTPGDTVLGTGTAVDSTSSWTEGSGIRSVAAMSYVFQASGPSNVGYIPIDVLSTGLVAASGDAASFVKLAIYDEDANSHSPVLDLTAKCSHGECWSAWNGSELTNSLCVANGSDYLVKVVAVTRASAGSGTDTSSALLDPVIKLDPPAPKTCPISVPISEFTLRVSPGASTGVAAPEPSTLSLMLGALAGFGLLTLWRRRVSPRRLTVVIRPSAAKRRSADRS